jgi:hypothetical protein
MEWRPGFLQTSGWRKGLPRKNEFLSAWCFDDLAAGFDHRVSTFSPPNPDFYPLTSVLIFLHPFSLPIRSNSSFFIHHFAFLSPFLLPPITDYLSPIPDIAVFSAL